MRIYHPLRRHGPRVTVTVLCLLLLSGIMPKLLPAWVIKPLLGFYGMALIQPFPVRSAKECIAGLLCVGGYVQRALVEVEDEQTALEAERDAYSAFACSVQRMNTATQQSFDAPTATLAYASCDHDQLQKIREKYKETVMAVPGYDEEYGESIQEHMNAEFGDEVAAAVLEGQQFTPQLKRHLINQANAAAAQREALLEAIENEQRSLLKSRRRLRSSKHPSDGRKELELAKESYGTLISLYWQSRQDEERLEEILTDRQHDIHTTARWERSTDSAFLQGYLYQDTGTRFPVLSEGIELIKRLRERRRVIGRVLARLD